MPQFLSYRCPKCLKTWEHAPALVELGMVRKDCVCGEPGVEIEMYVNHYQGHTIELSEDHPVESVSAKTGTLGHGLAYVRG